MRYSTLKLAKEENRHIKIFEKRNTHIARRDAYAHVPVRKNNVILFALCVKVSKVIVRV